MNIRPYQKLVAWKEAYALSRYIHQLTDHFPEEEKYGLKQQMRNASASVPINIAEGNTKRSWKEKAKFFEIALASLNELHCEVLLSHDKRYLDESKFQKAMRDIERVSYLLTRLLQAVIQRIPRRTPRIR